MDSAARKDFASPPAADEIFTETDAGATCGVVRRRAVPNRFLRDIGSFNLGVPVGPTRSARTSARIEKATSALRQRASAQPPPDALGTDYNGDGKGIGYNVPSLLGIDAVPPYYHNGACETLACVVRT